MSARLRIVVADDEPDMRKYFQKLLPRLGHQVLAAASTGHELVERCRDLKPDLILTDIKMPDMDGIEAAAQICRERPVPVILVSACHDPARIERTQTDHVLGYLAKLIKSADVEPVIALAMGRFEQAQALEDRKPIRWIRSGWLRREPIDHHEPGVLCLWLVAGIGVGRLAGLVMRSGGVDIGGDILVGAVGAGASRFLAGHWVEFWGSMGLPF
jgi:response regulator NasT